MLLLVEAAAADIVLDGGGGVRGTCVWWITSPPQTTHSSRSEATVARRRGRVRGQVTEICVFWAGTRRRRPRIILTSLVIRRSGINMYE